jgi:RNA polymerase nonessential primary-like sigma factor
MDIDTKESQGLSDIDTDDVLNAEIAYMDLLPTNDALAEPDGIADSSEDNPGKSIVYSRESSSCDAELTYIREVSPIPLLSYQEELRLARASRAGDAASRQAMIQHNLRLVLSLARRYRNRGLALLDMVSEGNLGLMRAVEKFNPELGFRFSTYATWWIKQAIDRSIMNQARDVRLPVHVIKEISLIQRKEMLLTHQLGRKPSRSELAAYCKMRLHELAFILDCHESSHESDQVIPDSEELHADCTGSEMHDGDPVRPMQLKGLQGTAQRWLNELSERQSAVLVRRFGLNGHKPMTLEQVGEDIGLTRERVRQIQIEAMRKLRRIASREGYDVDAFFGTDRISDHAYLNACQA